MTNHGYVPRHSFVEKTARSDTNRSVILDVFTEDPAGMATVLCGHFGLPDNKDTTDEQEREHGLQPVSSRSVEEPERTSTKTSPPSSAFNAARALVRTRVAW